MLYGNSGKIPFMVAALKSYSAAALTSPSVSALKIPCVVAALKSSSTRGGRIKIPPGLAFKIHHGKNPPCRQRYNPPLGDNVKVPLGGSVQISSARPWLYYYLESLIKAWCSLVVLGQQNQTLDWSRSANCDDVSCCIFRRCCHSLWITHAFPGTSHFGQRVLMYALNSKKLKDMGFHKIPKH